MVDKVKRDPFFDIVKFIAMFMVIYSHVVFYRPGFDLVAMPSYAMNFILVVNMPLFFMVSGCLSRRLHESRDWLKLVNRLVRYFWPLMVFSCVFAVYECIAGHLYSFSGISLCCLKKFLFCHWFFFVLAVCDVITFLIWKNGTRDCTKVLLGVMVFCVCLASSGRVLYATKIVAMIPFYWIGLVFLPKILSSRRMVMLVVVCLGLSIIIFSTYFFGNIATNGLSFYWDWLDIWHPSKDKIIRMIERFVIGGVGCLSIMCALKLIVENIPSTAIFAILGTETLGIYLFQGNVIKCFSNRIVSLDAGPLEVLIASLAVFAVCFVLVKGIKINKFIKSCAFGRNLF